MENQHIPNLYEDEIDLRIYILALFQNWYWVVIPAIFVATLTFLFTSLQPKTYQASALISVSSPSLDVVFDDRIVTDTNPPASTQNNDLPRLALSDAVVFDLFEQTQDHLPPSINTYSELAKQLDATAEARSELVTLLGTFEDPDLSALVVNSWGQLFTLAANQFFEGSVETSHAFLLDQLSKAETERNQIDIEWTEFQAQNESALFSAKLESQKLLQQNYIDRRNNLELLQYDIQGIKNQIEQNPNDANVLSDLTLFSLQNRAFGTLGNVQLEITSFESFSASPYQERVNQLNNLEIAVNNQQAELNERIESIDPTILELQEKLSELSTKGARLQSDRTVILDTYDTLANKVAEGDIEQSNTTGKAQITSRAVVPVEAQPRGRVTTTAIAAVVSTMLATVVILSITWWKEENANNSDSTIVPPVSIDSNGSSKMSEPNKLPAND